jgi:hypothetical protein
VANYRRVTVEGNEIFDTYSTKKDKNMVKHCCVGCTQIKKTPVDFLLSKALERRKRNEDGTHGFEKILESES